jgi:hypothetical protein
MFLIALKTFAVAGSAILVYLSIKSTIFLIGVINLILHLV